LAAIVETESALFAFSTVAYDQARADAIALEERLACGEPTGPLAGIRIAVKDLVLTKGLRTTFGSPLYADYVPEQDDIAVERLKAAGAIVIGKTNAAEFGYGAFGYNPLFPATRNPWDPALTPGGRARTRQRRSLPASARSRWEATAAARCGCLPLSPASSA
jgi:aspartyl-tRNA(Asn)/glutamyl-tRNA(Gln) amidotransferase subunit A